MIASSISEGIICFLNYFYPIFELVIFLWLKSLLWIIIVNVILSFKKMKWFISAFLNNLIDLLISLTIISRILFSFLNYPSFYSYILFLFGCLDMCSLSLYIISIYKNNIVYKMIFIQNWLILVLSYIQNLIFLLIILLWFFHFKFYNNYLFLFWYPYYT